MFGGDKNVLGQLSIASTDHAGWYVAAVTISDALKNLPRWTVVVDVFVKKGSVHPPQDGLGLSGSLMAE